MPAPLVKSFAARAGVSRRKAERLWDRAKELAKEAGRAEDYAYITGILKRMLGIKESGEVSSPDSCFVGESKYSEQTVYIIPIRSFPIEIDTPEKLGRWLVSQGMENGKFHISIQDETYYVISTGKDWFRVLEMILTTGGVQFESVSIDSSDKWNALVDVWGLPHSKKLLTETLPVSVKAALLARYFEIEKQLRNALLGELNLDGFMFALRRAVYVLLNWLAKEEQPTEQHKKFVGLV